MCQVPSVKWYVSGVRCQVKCQVSSVQCPVSGVGCQVLSVKLSLGRTTGGLSNSRAARRGVRFSPLSPGRRQRQTHTDIQTHTDTDIQTDRQTDRQTYGTRERACWCRKVTHAGHRHLSLQQSTTPPHSRETQLKSASLTAFRRKQLVEVSLISLLDCRRYDLGGNCGIWEGWGGGESSGVR